MVNEARKPKKMKRKAYQAELSMLEVELVKLQGWFKGKGLKIAVIFDGRDSAGKGGTIKRFTHRRCKLSPMDLEASSVWVDYSKAREAMQRHTSTDHAPW